MKPPAVLAPGQRDPGIENGAERGEIALARIPENPSTPLAARQSTRISSPERGAGCEADGDTEDGEVGERFGSL